MSAAEVGVFVQRLRGLMNEIGKGLGVGWRSDPGPQPAPPHPQRPTPKSTLSVLSSAKAQMTLPGE
jgi:hypothetical protein